MFFQIQLLVLAPLLVGLASASLGGPYLMWGPEKLHDLQVPTLVEASEQRLSALFRESKAIVIFLRNETSGRFSLGSKYPRFERFVKAGVWSYLPQHNLAADPLNYNDNVEVVPLSGTAEDEDQELINGFHEAVSIYGEGEVLGILANREEDAHFLSKREAKENEDDMRTTTAQTPTSNETDQSFIFVADGKKAILYANSALNLTISSFNSTIKLAEHNKAITFDDQRAKGYGRLNIIFTYDGEKIFVRFNFTLAQGTWTMKAVEVEYKDHKSIMSVVGDIYSIPSAPMGFSYRCSSNKLIFRNGNESLAIEDYQVQPWLNGSSRFGEVYDCVGFTTTPIWAGVLVSFFLIGILSVGIIALMDMKTPNRFESSRNKQLTFTVQE